MAVARFTTFTDTTEQTVYAHPCSVKAIIALPNKAQSGRAYIQLFDATNPTPGTDAPGLQVWVDTLALSGKTLHKFIFPGAVKFGTGCTIFCSTAAGGATASTTTTKPDWIEVVWEVGV